MYTLFLLIMSFLIAIILIPILIYLSHVFGLLDKPTLRKVHDKPMPFLGGVAILLSFILGLLISRPIEIEFQPIIIGGILIVLLGILDDVIDLNPLIKLIGQIGVAFIPISYGIVISNINILSVHIELGMFSVPFTIFWIVAIINAINLIDGLDGLATGVSVIALGTIGFISLLQGNIFIMMVCVILIGSSLGFLVFNFYPARIFLGDNGAMLLGYILSIVSLMGFKEVTFLSIIFPVIILAVPIIDMVVAILRRLYSKSSVIKADKEHLHHQLRYLGYSHIESVLILYLMASIYALGSVLLYVSETIGVIAIIIILIISTMIIVEYTNLLGNQKQPLLNIIRKAINRITQS